MTCLAAGAYGLEGHEGLEQWRSRMLAYHSGLIVVLASSWRRPSLFQDRHLRSIDGQLRGVIPITLAVVVDKGFLGNHPYNFTRGYKQSLLGQRYCLRSGPCRRWGRASERYYLFAAVKDTTCKLLGSLTAQCLAWGWDPEGDYRISLDLIDLSVSSQPTFYAPTPALCHFDIKNTPDNTRLDTFHIPMIGM